MKGLTRDKLSCCHCHCEKCSQFVLFCIGPFRLTSSSVWWKAKKNGPPVQNKMKQSHSCLRAEGHKKKFLDPPFACATGKQITHFCSYLQVVMTTRRRAASAISSATTSAEASLSIPAAATSHDSNDVQVMCMHASVCVGLYVWTCVTGACMLVCLCYECRVLSDLGRCTWSVCVAERVEVAAKVYTTASSTTVVMQLVSSSMLTCAGICLWAIIWLNAGNLGVTTCFMTSSPEICMRK